jgi:hypothetical protein
VAAVSSGELGGGRRALELPRARARSCAVPAAVRYCGGCKRSVEADRPEHPLRGLARVALRVTGRFVPSDFEPTDARSRLERRLLPRGLRPPTPHPTARLRELVPDCQDCEHPTPPGAARDGATCGNASSQTKYGLPRSSRPCRWRRISVSASRSSTACTAPWSQCACARAWASTPRRHPRPTTAVCCSTWGAPLLRKSARRSSARMTR